MLCSINGADQIKLSDLELLYLHSRASFGQVITNKTDNVMEDERNRIFYHSLVQVKQ
jgi:hypothetical protein